VGRPSHANSPMLSRSPRQSAINRWARAGWSHIGRLRERIHYRLATNLTLRAYMPSCIAADADYAIQLARGHLRTFERHFDLSRVAILELGPGINLGPQLILASHGAEVTVSDRFLTLWNSAYHPRLYRALKARWSGAAAAIDRVLEARGYPTDVITCVAQPAENLSDLADGAFDGVVSNAVLEHISDLHAVAATLARVTRSGGQHFHQIDFRDHKDFSRPLEFLLMSDDEYRQQPEHARGNRRRLSEWTTALIAAGFKIADVEINETVREDYFEAFVPRLRRADSTYRDWPEDDLRVLGARVWLRR
jgi:SAM-dependent methyltransferase